MRNRPCYFALVLLLAGCAHKSAAPEGGDKKDGPLPSVQTARVTVGPLERTLAATGTLQARRDREATLSPPVAGVLDDLPIRLGQVVARGQVIARLSTRAVQGQIAQARALVGQNLVQVAQARANAAQQRAQTRAAILQARSSLSGAEATLSGAEATLSGAGAAAQNAAQTLARQRTLFAEGLVAQKDVEAAALALRTARAQADAQRQAVQAQRQVVRGQAQAVAAARAAAAQDAVKEQDVAVARRQVQNAEGALQTVQAQQALYTLRAPLAGRVTLVGATRGESVDTATKIATVADLSALVLQINVPADAARAVRAGQTVAFSVPGQARELRATVASVGTGVDAATGTVAALAPVPNPRGLLRDDATVRARVITERRASALVVPASAVLRDAQTGKASVLAIGGDSVAHVVPVTTGLSADGRVEIVSGLKAGQRVAVSGQYGLADGAKVSVTDGAGTGASDAP